MSRVPETSQEAKLLKTDDSKCRDYDKIVSALLAIGEAHYEGIAIKMGVEDLNVVSRRMKEMRELGLLENTGEKKPTSRGRNAFVHKLTELGKSRKPIAIPPKETPLPTNTIPVRAHTRKLKKELPNQQPLF